MKLFSLDVLEEKDTTVCSRCKEPGLCWVEGQIKYSKFVSHCMATQNLHGNNQRISHQVRIDHTMENMDSSVVRCTGHERVPTVILDRPQSPLVVF